MSGTECMLGSTDQNKRPVRWHKTRSLILRTLPAVNQKTPFEVQPDDDFTKKPKYVADLINFNYFYIIKIVLDLKFIYILVIIEKNGNASPENHKYQSRIHP